MRLPPERMTATFLPASSSRSLDGRRSRRRARPFGEQPPGAQEEQDRLPHLLLGDEHDIIDPGAHREGEGERLARRQSLREGALGVEGEQTARPPRFVDGGRPRRLHADHANIRVDRLGDHRRARDAAAAARAGRSARRGPARLRGFPAYRSPPRRSGAARWRGGRSASPPPPRAAAPRRGIRRCPCRSSTTSAPSARIERTLSGFAASGP